MGLELALLQAAVAVTPIPAAPQVAGPPLPQRPIVTERQLARGNECAAHYAYAALLMPVASGGTGEGRTAGRAQGAMFEMRAKQVLIRVGRIGWANDYLPQDILDAASILFDETLEREGKTPGKVEETLAACDEEYGFLLPEGEEAPAVVAPAPAASASDPNFRLP
jgi:hypothetical protein